MGAQCSPGLGEAGTDGPIRDAESEGKLAVVVAVVMAEHDGGGLSGRDPAKGRDKVRSLSFETRVLPRTGPPQSPHQLADVPEPLLPTIGDREIDRDPVQPSFGGGIWSPARPNLESLEEALLDAILSGRRVAEDSIKCPEEARVAFPIEPVEVPLVSRAVRLAARLQLISHKATGRWRN
jgi:hypothetical protein